MLEELVRLAPVGGFLSGLALQVSAIIAAVTLVFFNLRSREDLVYRDLSALYKRFWDSDEFAKVRRWIDSDHEFSSISLAIDIVTGPSLVRPLTEPEAKAIESLDRFCAIMMEAFFLREIGKSHHRRKMVDAMFLDHWVRKLDERSQMREYVERFWPRLHRHMRDRRPYFKQLARAKTQEGILRP